MICPIDQDMVEVLFFVLPVFPDLVVILRLVEQVRPVVVPVAVDVVGRESV